jgi:hypothetical protein
MPVFGILAHDDPPLLARLVERLAPHPVVLHLDARSPVGPFPPLPSATWVTDRVAVRWGGFSVVRATARLYAAALAIADPLDHVVLLSGRCYPARPVAEFVAHLADAPHRQHCRAARLLDGTPAAGQVTKRWLFDAVPAGCGPLRLARAALRRGIATAAPRRSATSFAPLVPVAGSQWTSLTADCVKDLLSMAAEPGVARPFRHTQAPDETFFQTLLWNSRWREETADPALADRAGRVTADFSNHHYVDHSLKGIRTSVDLDAVLRSEQYFVRKVDSTGSADLLDALDARLR